MAGAHVPSHSTAPDGARKGLGVVGPGLSRRLAGTGPSKLHRYINTSNGTNTIEIAMIRYSPFLEMIRIARASISAPFYFDYI